VQLQGPSLRPPYPSAGALQLLLQFTCVFSFTCSQSLLLSLGWQRCARVLFAWGELLHQSGWLELVQQFRVGKSTTRGAQRIVAVVGVTAAAVQRRRERVVLVDNALGSGSVWAS